MTIRTMRLSTADEEILDSLVRAFPEHSRSDIIREAIRHYAASISSEDTEDTPPLDDFGESRFNGKYLKKLESCLMTLDEQQLSMFKGQVQTILGNAERAARLRDITRKP